MRRSVKKDDLCERAQVARGTCNGVIRAQRIVVGRYVWLRSGRQRHASRLEEAVADGGLDIDVPGRAQTDDRRDAALIAIRQRAGAVRIEHAGPEIPVGQHADGAAVDAACARSGIDEIDLGTRREIGDAVKCVAELKAGLLHERGQTSRLWMRRVEALRVRIVAAVEHRVIGIRAVRREVIVGQIVA